jgi:hypothetical protein
MSLIAYIAYHAQGIIHAKGIPGPILYPLPRLYGHLLKLIRQITKTISPLYKHYLYLSLMSVS